MGIFDDIRTKGASYRLTEEALYAEALREIESGERRDGIWAKALSESNMDQGKAGARYIKLRVQSLKDEVSLVINALNNAEIESRKNVIADAAIREQALTRAERIARIEQTAREKEVPKLALESRSPALKRADERMAGYFLTMLGSAGICIIYFFGGFVSKLPTYISMMLLLGSLGGIIGGLVSLIKSLRARPQDHTGKTALGTIAEP